MHNINLVIDFTHFVPQPFVTELDLRLAQLSVGAVDYLREVIPSAPNEVGESMYDYEAWLDDVFDWTP
jgi:hypothetical protein